MSFRTSHSHTACIRFDKCACTYYPFTLPYVESFISCTTPHIACVHVDKCACTYNLFTLPNILSWISFTTSHIACVRAGKWSFHLHMSYDLFTLPVVLSLKSFTTSRIAFVYVSTNVRVHIICSRYQMFWAGCNTQLYTLSVYSDTRLHKCVHSCHIYTYTYQTYIWTCYTKLSVYSSIRLDQCVSSLSICLLPRTLKTHVRALLERPVLV